MKIGMIRNENATEICSICSMETFIKKVKCENKKKFITQLRESIPTLQGSSARYIHLGKIPRVYPVSEFRLNTDGGWVFKKYQGIVLVEVNRLSGTAEAEYVKAKAALLPQTLAAMVGASGRSTKIWVRFTLPDGTLPESEEQAALFHARAYQVAVQCYQPLFPYAITMKEPTLDQSFRMTTDASPYFRPEAAAFCLEQPAAMTDGTSFGERKRTEKNPVDRMELTYQSYHTLTVMFQILKDMTCRETVRNFSAPEAGSISKSMVEAPDFSGRVTRVSATPLLLVVRIFSASPAPFEAVA